MAAVDAVEADDYDYDSTFGGDRSSLASSSTSLSSAITAYQYEHGRRYHAYQAGRYSFPNDEQELNRMDIEHANQRLQLNGALHLCPLDDPKEILDIGTGSGIWAIDMADQYPECQIIGTDLSPIQPSWVPPNCRFEIDSFEDDWAFGENRFDMIHERFLLGSVHNYGRLYKEVLTALKPGGWFEVVEMECGTYCDDNTLPEKAASIQWWSLLDEAFRTIGIVMPTMEGYREALEDAGFVNVTGKLMKRPTNDWPKDTRMKEIGKYSCLNFLEGLEAFTMKPFTQCLGWSAEECHILIAKVRSETLKRQIHGWQKGFVWYAQKPYPKGTPAATRSTPAPAATQPTSASAAQPTPAPQHAPAAPSTTITNPSTER